MTHPRHETHEPVSTARIFVFALILAGFTLCLYVLAQAMHKGHFFDGELGRASIAVARSVAG